MDGRERLQLLRCADDVQDKTVINRIMLKFRPIAPKPAAEGPLSGDATPDNKNLLGTNRRTKRKYVRVRKNSGYRRKKRIISDLGREVSDPPNKTVVTLQLLPEKSVEAKDRDQSPPARPSWWCNFDHAVAKDFVDLANRDSSLGLNLQNSQANVSDRTVVESSVTVECVTETCMEGGQLGSTDSERVENLERGTCPGLISDGLNRVRWINGAYRRMLIGRPENKEPSPEIAVRLVIKEGMLPYFAAYFTGRVRLQYTWQKEKHTEMVPCDVWRMDSGGFAWRLDVEAALSLGRRR